MIPGLMIEDFEYGDSSYLASNYDINAPGNELLLDLSGPPNVNFGQKSLTMNYRINNDPPSDYAGIERQNYSPTDWRNHSSICIWIKNGDFLGHLVVQFREQSGEAWKHEIQLQNISLQEVCIPLTEDYFLLADFSSPQNRLMDLSAINNYALYLEGGGKTGGTIFLDSLRLQP